MLCRMSEHLKSKPKIKVILEPVPDPDPEALNKAFAMLFRRGPYRKEEQRFKRESGEQQRLI